MSGCNTRKKKIATAILATDETRGEFSQKPLALTADLAVQDSKSSSRERISNYTKFGWLCALAALSAQCALLILAVVFFPLPTLVTIAVAVAAASLYKFFTKPKAPKDDDIVYEAVDHAHRYI